MPLGSFFSSGQRVSAEARRRQTSSFENEKRGPDADFRARVVDTLRFVDRVVQTGDLILREMPA